MPQNYLPSATPARLLARAAIAFGITAGIMGPLLVSAAVITLPHSFADGTLASASAVNANFTALAVESNAQHARLAALEQPRGVTYTSGLGPNDQTDTGQIVSRVHSFTKAAASTEIRVTWTDNLRVAGSAKGCRWEIRFDGATCPSGSLHFDAYTAADNTHDSRSLIAYCGGLSAATHTIGIWVSNVPGYTGSDCYTEWADSRWLLESEEVRKL